MNEINAKEYAEKIRWLKTHGYESNSLNDYSITIMVARFGKIAHFRHVFTTRFIVESTIEEIIKSDEEAWKRVRPNMHKLFEEEDSNE